MRKVIRVMVSSILVAMLYLNSVWANELNDRTLDFRNFTVNDVSQFIEQEGIQIPEDIQRVSDYEDIIYSIMMSAYEDPQYRPEYQYTKMQELAEIITKKVRVYTFAEASTYGKLDKAKSVANEKGLTLSELVITLLGSAGDKQLKSLAEQELKERPKPGRPWDK